LTPLDELLEIVRHATSSPPKAESRGGEVTLWGSIVDLLATGSIGVEAETRLALHPGSSLARDRPVAGSKSDRNGDALSVDFQE
jgi:hypothetical protein